MFRMERAEDGQTFRLFGELDLGAVQCLRDEIRAAAPPGGIRLDLSGLEFIDSTGIQALIDISKELRGEGKLVLASPGGQVARVLQITGIQTLPAIVVEGGEEPEGPSGGARS
jgi:anti-sigma B factor antagonist